MNTMKGVKKEAYNRLAMQVVKLHQFSENSKRKLLLEGISFLLITIFSGSIVYNGFYFIGAFIVILTSYFLYKSFKQTYKANLLINEAMDETATFLNMIKLGKSYEPEVVKEAYNGFVLSFKSKPYLANITILEFM